MKTFNKFCSLILSAVTLFFTGLIVLSISGCKDSEKEEFKNKYVSGYALYNATSNNTGFDLFVGRDDGITPITDAVVKFNGNVFACDVSGNSYGGTVDLQPGDEAELTVTCEGDTFTQVVKIPNLIKITSPLNGVIIDNTVDNTITWQINGDLPDKIYVNWTNLGFEQMNEIPSDSLSYTISACNLQDKNVEVVAKNVYEEPFLYFVITVSEQIGFN